MFGLKGPFEIIARYLDFAVALLDFRIDDKYSALHNASGELVAFFVIGSLLATLITKASRKHMRSILGSNSEKSDFRTALGYLKVDWILVVVTSFVGTTLLHYFLGLISPRYGIAGLGDFKDTINALLAFHSVAMPISAIASRYESIGTLLISDEDCDGIFTRIVAAFFIFGGGAFLLYLEIYRLWTIAHMHDVQFVPVFKGALAFLLLVVLPLCIIAYIVWREKTRRFRLSRMFEEIQMEQLKRTAEMLKPLTGDHEVPEA